MDKVKERALRLISDGQKSCVQVLRYKCNQFYVHQRNLVKLITKIHRVINQIDPLLLCLVNIGTKSVVIKFY